MNPKLHIEFFFDLICPWCLIGKHHLRRALDHLIDSDPEVPVAIEWRSVQLIANVPESGWPFSEFYERRLGSKDAVRARQMQVNAAAARAGTAIDFSRIVTFPNTARAHRLLAFAKRHLDPVKQDRLLDRLFAAYFQLGEDLNDVRILARIASEQALDSVATRLALADDNRAFESPAPRGVPYFVFNRRTAVSGAQPPEVLHAAMRRAVASSLPSVAMPQ